MVVAMLHRIKIKNASQFKIICNEANIFTNPLVYVKDTLVIFI